MTTKKNEKNSHVNMTTLKVLCWITGLLVWQISGIFWCQSLGIFAIVCYMYIQCIVILVIIV